VKIGAYNLGPNAFSGITIAKVDSGGLTLTQMVPGIKGGTGSTREITLSANQAQLLKEVLA